MDSSSPLAEPKSCSFIQSTRLPLLRTIRQWRDNHSACLARLEVIQEPSKAGKRKVVLRLPEPSTVVLAPYLHGDLALVGGPGEHDRSIVDLSPKVLLDDVLRWRHRRHDKGHSFCPVDGRLDMGGVGKGLPDHVFEEDLGVLLNYFMDHKVRVWFVTDLHHLKSTTAPSSPRSASGAA